MNTKSWGKGELQEKVWDWQASSFQGQDNPEIAITTTHAPWRQGRVPHAVLDFLTTVNKMYANSLYCKCRCGLCRSECHPWCHNLKYYLLFPIYYSGSCSSICVSAFNKRLNHIKSCLAPVWPYNFWYVWNICFIHLSGTSLSSML